MLKLLGIEPIKFSNVKVQALPFIQIHFCSSLYIALEIEEFKNLRKRRKKRNISNFIWNKISR